VVEGDYIGTDVYGTSAVANFGGVFIEFGAANNTIGGTNAGARDIISANSDDGVQIDNAGTTGNVVEGHYIGTDVSVAKPLGNESNGVALQYQTTKYMIGGTTASARDVISGNTGSGPNSDGVDIIDPGTSDNVVEGDFIGTDSAGGASLGNSGNGILIASGATDNTIGGTLAGARDVISGNTYSGIAIEVSGTTGNLVECNSFGTNAAGINLGNFVDGVILEGTSGTTIEADIIDNSGAYGIAILDGDTDGIVIVAFFNKRVGNISYS